MVDKLVANSTGVSVCMSRQRVADTEPKLHMPRLQFAARMQFRDHYPVSWDISVGRSTSPFPAAAWQYSSTGVAGMAVPNKSQCRRPTTGGGR